MRWLPVAVVVVAMVLTSWRDVVFIITRGAGESQTPSAFAVWWLQWMGWIVVALGVLAIATGTTSRRSVLVSIALILAAGTVWLTFW